MLLARARVFLARHPSVYWLAVSALAAVAAAIAWSAASGVESARLAWGEQRTVWVAVGEVAPGGPIVVAERSLPAAAVPDGAAERVPTGAVAVQRLTRGEVVTDADLGTGVLELLPPGWRAVAITTDPARLPAVVGDHVSVYADGRVLAPDGIVVSAVEGVLTVAVAEVDAGDVASAAGAQTAVLALRRP